MSGIKDRIQRLEIKQEPTDARETKVVKVDVERGVKLQDYDFQRLRKSGEGEYSIVREKYGALAATDPGRAAKSRKDARFSINPLLKGPLAIEEEERRVIDEKVREKIEQLSEAARQEAARQGYAEGLEKGFREAFQKWSKEGSARLQRFETFLQSCDGAKQEIFAENERFLMEVVFRVARMALLRELKTDRDHLIRVSREILERIGIRENIKIRVNPRDHETIELLREALQASFGGKLQNLHIEASDQVGDGGCVVETQWNAIDASIQTQLDNIYDALLGGGEAGGSGPSGPAPGAPSGKE